MEKVLDYKSKWGTAKVELSISQYLNNKNMFIELIGLDGEEPEPYGNVTVNLIEVPEYCGYVDTNNMPEMEKFLSDNDIGEFSGLTLKSGFCVYPLYIFNAERLRELCPDGMERYEKSIGVEKNEPEKERGR